MSQSETKGTVPDGARDKGDGSWWRVSLWSQKGRLEASGLTGIEVSLFCIFTGSLLYQGEVIDMRMPIYGQIRANRIKTVLLFMVFILLFCGLGFLIGTFVEAPVFGLLIMLVIVMVLFLISYISGQNIIASMAGARPVQRHEEPYLYHTIEGIAIAADIPTPKAYIIETDIPNAFAAGNKPDKAVIAVTRGLLNRLDRLELEGVIAHEIAHIRNYDVLTATVAVVMAGTIITISEFMLHSSRYAALGAGRSSRRSSSGSGSGGGGIIILIMLLVAILAPIFARLLKYAISREREYLADATAAELTGYPAGLAGALEKIADAQIPEGPLDHKALHGLYIINPSMNINRMQFTGKLFSTHPDISDRIRRLRGM